MLKLTSINVEKHELSCQKFQAFLQDREIKSWKDVDVRRFLFYKVATRHSLS